MTAGERVEASAPHDNVIPFPIGRRHAAAAPAAPRAAPPDSDIRRAMTLLAESDAALGAAAAGLARSAARLTENLHWLERQAARAGRIRDDAARIQAAIEAGALDVLVALADELRGRGDAGVACGAP